MSQITRELLFELKRAKNVLILTGADISAEGGLSTFKSPGSKWENYNIPDLSSKQGFEKDPQLVWEWYQHRRKSVRKLGATKSHYLISELIKLLNHVDLFTQNVDCLHQVAGNKNVIELYGNIFQSKCDSCEEPFTKYSLDDNSLKHCDKCNGPIRPNVKWFGEQLDQKQLFLLKESILKSEVILFIGIYPDMYPADEILEIGKINNKYKINISKEESVLSKKMNINLVGIYEILLEDLLTKYKKIFLE